MGGRSPERVDGMAVLSFPRLGPPDHARGTPKAGISSEIPAFARGGERRRWASMLFCVFRVFAEGTIGFLPGPERTVAVRARFGADQIFEDDLAAGGASAQQENDDQCEDDQSETDIHQRLLGGGFPKNGCGQGDQDHAKQDQADGDASADPEFVPQASALPSMGS